MRKIRLVAGLFAAVALVAMALPVTVGACPARLEAKACCASTAPGTHTCGCCAKSTRPSPGSCTVQKARPDAVGVDAPPDPTPLGIGVLAAAPSLTLPDSALGASFHHARITPGWDPGSHGFLIPLRL